MMPEPPDFEQIARAVLAPLGDELGEHFDDDAMAARIAEQLRQVWNARGAADLALIDPDEDGYVSELLDVRDALRTLDR